MGSLAAHVDGTHGITRHATRVPVMVTDDGVLRPVPSASLPGRFPPGVGRCLELAHGSRTVCPTDTSIIPGVVVSRGGLEFRRVATSCGFGTEAVSSRVAQTNINGHVQFVQPSWSSTWRFGLRGEVRLGPGIGV